MASRWRNLLFLYFMLNIWSIRGENTNDDVTKTARTDKTDTSKEVDGDSETPKSDGPTEHAKGSICGYCKYCQFCSYCDKDCPCTKSRSKPNCHLCKYCKYCYLCSALCKTICQPGGIIDTVSSKIWESLPTFDTKMKESVDKDIDSAKEWIKEYL